MCNFEVEQNKLFSSIQNLKAKCYYQTFLGKTLPEKQITEKMTALSLEGKQLAKVIFMNLSRINN